MRKLEELAERHYGGSKDAIPGGRFPDCWRRSLDGLMASYHRICAYLCLYIPRGTGARSVDHMIAKSAAWNQAYEWTNYRLACSFRETQPGPGQEHEVRTKSGAPSESSERRSLAP